MATLVLQAAGQALGGFLGPIGAVVGRAAGALAGNVIDQRLFGDNKTRVVGRIDDLTVQTSSEGNAIPKVYGRMRLSGTVIWATDFHESYSETGGGKGGGPSVREYSYSASFAVGICEGPIARIGRVWADGEELDLTKVTMRVYTGDEQQGPDCLIAAIEADTANCEGIEGSAPAYRGLAYVVFERLPIGEFGNRLPQLSFEVVRPIGSLEPHVKAVTMIPGATEFGYEPERVDRELGPGEARSDNRHLGVAASDFEASLDELLAVCPNLERVALVVAWFGDNLNAGECHLQPKVEAAERPTTAIWTVSGIAREAATVVSSDANGSPNYGGTPSDGAVMSAIGTLKARGLKVVFYPFILMDIPSGNGLIDPYGGSEQAAFPWRGRITGSPAPGRDNTSDRTSSADAAVASFVGRAQPSDFAASGATVAFSGSEWSLRRMVLHYAHLTTLAGGVDAFLVASEMRGLSTLRGAVGYPFVTALSAIVDDVRQVVGSGTKVSYVADWSEYFGHQIDGNFFYHLDPLWANPNVDFIAIDNYWPLSDWRDGEHKDSKLAASDHDIDYLLSNVYGGEGYDWYYADDAGRAAQNRIPIDDWVYRYKDLASWWSNRHFDRIDGEVAAMPSPWVPQSKPVWFTEVGCPAVERGANQPNVFYDPKSSESFLPYFSSGRRDDAIQRAYLTAMITAFDPALSPDIERYNPVSAAYGGRMIDPSTIHVWTWDARPWPAFPARTDVWSDGDNWQRGHWVTGRFGSAPFEDLVRRLFAEWGQAPPEVAGVPTVLDGFIVEQPMSLRSAVEPLTEALSVVGADTGTAIRFVGLTAGAVASFERLDFVETQADAPLVSETREEAFDLPVEVRLAYHDSGREFRHARARHRPASGSARQTDEIRVPASLNDGLAAELAELALAARWTRRTVARFALPPSELALQPGDVISLTGSTCSRDYLVEEIEDLGRREITARSLERAALTPSIVPASSAPPARVTTSTAPFAFAMNLPVINESVPDHQPWLGVYADPFREMGIWRSSGSDFELIGTLAQPSSLGVVVGGIGTGHFWRWDDSEALTVQFLARAPQSRQDVSVLNGANVMAVQTTNGGWEVLQFANARLVGERTYELSRLLRGQLGTEDNAATGIASGASVALLDGTIVSVPTPRDAVGLERTYRVGPLEDGIGGDAVTTFAFTPNGRGLAPYAPVRGNAVRLPGGSVKVTWIRRPRKGGDPWYDGETVPPVEIPELYRLEIIGPVGGVVRSAQLSEPSFMYSQAAQQADFGTSPDVLSFRVAQLATGFGAGPFLEVTVDVEQS